MASTIDIQKIQVEHVTIHSSKDFDAVRSNLESIIPRIDDGIFTLLRYRETARALRELEVLPPLSIFGFRDHGAAVQVAGLQRQAMQYDIGNPLTATKMTRHRISAGLYAPIRVLLREDSDGVAFEYDRPISTFGQFGDPDVDEVARNLDKDLQAVLESAAS
ncbi:MULTISPECIES: DUF302 domain-containing protein [Rhizobium]|uniref:DUF302 domain-containing protein n=1 Tax=Rhizobium TaxID=379 RepID=UPI001441B52E|nr:MULTISPECIES: DUF302 domain-containing protein [Rhizobium]MBY3169894.1 DUF302 domain-containing protein [Rhizobium laguerreae]MBY5558899.1 DUF302 domain-containing protein [Rhizobium leguminosarum]MBY5666178.1 DUF302 domain-containing protein [Rhizobium leguminosarum]MBY5679476.1 DUF302 domain-containing protein [Rhizobium leguminosarum]MBY5727969.1 DUF302 domain-containing protein [Rhizobium leguminosarum]